MRRKPPLDVALQAKKGLELRSKMPPSKKGGTSVGIARARDLSNRRAVSDKTIMRMDSFFSRHSTYKKTATSKGNQAWLLWGGNAGRKWAKQEKKKILEEQ